MAVLVTAFALGATITGPGAAQQPGDAGGVAVSWGAGYQMGTFWAGIALEDGARLTFYCGDGASDDAPFVRPGPYILLGLPAGAGLASGDAVPLELFVDGEALSPPLAMIVIGAAQGAGQGAAQGAAQGVELEWTPAQGVPEGLVEALRHGEDLHLRGPGIVQDFPLSGSDPALAMIGDACAY